MKKLILLLILSFTLSATSYSQMNCEPCQWGQTYSTIDTICIQTFVDQARDTVYELGIFVIINYRKCDNALIFDGAVVVDNRSWNNSFWSSWTGTGSPPWTEVGGGPCTAYTNPLTASEIKSIYSHSVNTIIKKEHISTTIDTYFTGACRSKVKITYPPNSFLVSAPNDSGQVDTFKISVIYTYLPCTTACCKVSWELRAVVIEESYTEYRWVPVSYEGDNEICNAAELPEYSDSLNKIWVYHYDSLGNLDSSSGEFGGQEPCEIVCNTDNFPPPPPGFVGLGSDLSKKTPIELTALPTLFNQFIYFTANKPILRINMYDMTGRIVLSAKAPDTAELNTSNLKAGSYFIQVVLPDNVIKSIKVIKN